MENLLIVILPQRDYSENMKLLYQSSYLFGFMHVWMGLTTQYFRVLPSYVGLPKFVCYVYVEVKFLRGAKHAI